MAHNAQRSNDVAVRKCRKMSGGLVVLIDFKVFGDTLFNDEHLPSQGIYRGHELISGPNLDYRGQCQLL